MLSQHSSMFVGRGRFEVKGKKLQVHRLKNVYTALNKPLDLGIS